MPALWMRTPGDGPKPAVVCCNGLDSSKKLLRWWWLPHALARRGSSTLCVDQPGTREALRHAGLPVRRLNTMLQALASLPVAIIPA